MLLSLPSLVLCPKSASYTSYRHDENIRVSTFIPGGSVYGRPEPQQVSPPGIPKHNDAITSASGSNTPQAP